MKTNFKSIVFVIATIVFLTPNGLIAQNNVKENKTSFSIETDPTTFVFNGYSAHLRIKPANWQHLVLGVGVYAMDLPDFFVNINAENKDKGWNVRINSAYALFGEYYFKEANSKWFAGIQTAIQDYKISNDNIANEESKYSTFLIMPSIGYTWLPFKFPLYIKPWAGIGYTKKISGNNSVSDLSYDISPVTAFITFHIGYTF